MIVVILGALAISCKNQNENKVIYMVRHAEKDVVPKNNPALNTDGVIRSVDLANWFSKIGIDTIFTTDYTRTKETAKPLAEAKNLELSLYDAGELDDFSQKLERMEADTILVIGHSNTILEQIESLGLERPQEKIRENEYDKIFEVKLGKKVVTTHIYGSKSKE
jgi:phosphohistidine phosphatase SixA